MHDLLPAALRLRRGGEQQDSPRSCPKRAGTEGRPSTHLGAPSAQSSLLTLPFQKTSPLPPGLPFSQRGLLTCPGPQPARVPRRRLADSPPTPTLLGPHDPCLCAKLTPLDSLSLSSAWPTRLPPRTGDPEPRPLPSLSLSPRPRPEIGEEGGGAEELEQRQRQGYLYARRLQQTRAGGGGGRGGGRSGESKRHRKKARIRKETETQRKAGRNGDRRKERREEGKMEKQSYKGREIEKRVPEGDTE